MTPHRCGVYYWLFPSPRELNTSWQFVRGWGWMRRVAEQRFWKHERLMISLARSLCRLPSTMLTPVAAALSRITTKLTTRLYASCSAIPTQPERRCQSGWNPQIYSAASGFFLAVVVLRTSSRAAGLCHLMQSGWQQKRQSRQPNH